MNWDAIGAIAEIIGALAVVVSLVYLALQIRQNTAQVEEQTKALRQEALNASSSDFTRFRESISRNPQVASLWRRGKTQYFRLTEDEQAQLDMLFGELFWAYENILLRRGLTAIDDDLWKLVEQNISVWLSYPGIREWWPEERRFHSSEFVEMVDRLSVQYSRSAS